MADEVVIDVQGGDDKRKELKGEIVELEKKKQELTRDNLELKEKVERLLEEIEELRSLEVEMKQRFEEMEIEMKQFEEEKKVLESISTRAVELESEVIKIQEDLITALRGGDETAVEVAELKRGLMEKGESFESFEKDVESLKKARGVIEKRVRDLERRIGVLEVKEMKEKSKKLRAEEEMRERSNQKDEAVNELQRKVEDLKLELVKDVGELGNCKSEKKRIEEALSESKKMEMEIESKKDELLKKVEEAKKTLAVLNERILEPTNEVRATKVVASDGERKNFFRGSRITVANGCCWISWSCRFGGSDIVRMLLQTKVI